MADKGSAIDKQVNGRFYDLEGNGQILMLTALVPDMGFDSH